MNNCKGCAKSKKNGGSCNRDNSKNDCKYKSTTLRENGIKITHSNNDNGYCKCDYLSKKRCL